MFSCYSKTRNRSLDRTKRTVSIQKRDSMENRNTKRELSCWKINPCYGKQPKIWEMMQTYGHNCKSLPFFTFIKDRIRITRCRGTCKGKDTKLESTGPLLITLGMSGPVLKLSAWGEFCMIKLSVYHICKLVDVILKRRSRKKYWKR
jgi:hypothetical protein